MTHELYQPSREPTVPDPGEQIDPVGYLEYSLETDALLYQHHTDRERTLKLLGSITRKIEQGAAI